MSCIKQAGLRLSMVALVATFVVMASGFAQAEPFTFLYQIGSEGSGDGQFLWPSHGAVDTSGNIYIVDSGNGRIQKFNSDGDFITKWGSWGDGDGQFSSLSTLFAIAADSSGNVYEADACRIQKFNSSGGFIKKWGTCGTGPGQLGAPIHGITVDSINNWVYVSDSANSRVQKFDTEGNFITTWGTNGPGDSEFMWPAGIAVDSFGHVYVGDPGDVNPPGGIVVRVRKFDSNGNFIAKWEAGSSFNGPRQIAIDPSNNLYIAEDGYNRVRKFTTDGILIPTPGLTGGWNVYGVAVHASGRVYVISSSDSSVRVFQSSASPISNAGSGQTVHIGSMVTLDGSGSTDPGGSTLTYQWSFDSKPPGSGASLSDPTIVNPAFTTDIQGDYVVRLIVTNSLGNVSSPSIVTISTTNSPPVADAGADQSIIVIGTNVHLNGSQSYDLDGDAINYSWTLTSSPAGSTASLIGVNSATPTFIADVHGTYVAQLVVSDPWANSGPDTVTISFENVKPVANAGTSLSVPVGVVIFLNGGGSNDANGDILSYAWSLISTPANSSAGISSPTAKIASLVPDLPGTYVAQLIVNDGIVDSDPSTVQLQVFSTESGAIASATRIQNSVSSIPVIALKNANLKNALSNKINAVIASIDAGLYADALDQLENDILGKTDGCAITGAPDKNDWITSCQEQNQIYPLVQEAIWIVEGLLVP